MNAVDAPSVQRDETEGMRCVHPLQRPWYQAEHFRHLRPKALLAIDGGILLGLGIAVQSTSTATRVWFWAPSQNVNRMPNPRANADIIETTAERYTPLVLEKRLVERSQRDSRFLQFPPPAS